MITDKEKPAFSFVGMKEHGVCWWHPERSGDYTQDCKMGKEFAAELLAHIRHTGDGMILKPVISAMIAHGSAGAVEVGFLTELGLYLSA